MVFVTHCRVLSHLDFQWLFDRDGAALVTDLWDVPAPWVSAVSSSNLFKSQLRRLFLPDRPSLSSLSKIALPFLSF